MPARAPVIKTTGLFIAVLLFPHHVSHLNSPSGIQSAINGQIRSGDVRGLGTGHERHQRGDFVSTPVPVERCSGFLRHRPIAAAGFKSVSIGPGWTLFTVIPRLPTSLDRAWLNIFTA